MATSEYGDQLERDFGSSCMHPAAGQAYMEAGMTILIKTAKQFGFDPISQGNYPGYNQILWDDSKFR